MKLITFCVFGLLMLLALGGLAINKYFYKKLKADYPKVYKSLGEPSLFFNQSIKHGFLVNKFIWKRQYLAENDNTLTKLCNFMLAYGVVIWGVFIIFVVMAFFS